MLTVDAEELTKDDETIAEQVRAALSKAQASRPLIMSEHMGWAVELASYGDWAEIELFLSYIQQLEQIALKTWYRDQHDLCGVCEAESAGYWEPQRAIHDPNCVIPILLEKAADG